MEQKVKNFYNENVIKGNKIKNNYLSGGFVWEKLKS